MKKMSIVLLALLLTLSLAACGGDGGQQEAASDDAAGAEDSTPYHIGFTLLGTDWVLNYMRTEAEYTVMTENADNGWEYISADFSTDKMQSGVQSMLSSGIDGLIYSGIYTTLTSTIIEGCEAAGTAFVMSEFPPLDDQIEELRASDQFVGYFGANVFGQGYQLGEIAARQGGTVALTISGPIGDTSHDLRVAGFTAAFEEGGGKVVGNAHCNFPTEAIDKSSDLLAAHPDVDAVYGATGVHTLGMVNALKNHNRTDTVKVYCTELDSDLLPEVRAGRMIGDGGTAAEFVLATTLLLNRLAGHPILDDDGKQPVSDEMLPLIVTAENADSFEKEFIDEHPFTEAMIKKFLWKYNKDVSWADYQDFIDNYSLDRIIEQKNAS
ncbi:MAG: sugar ABC transporter substrate-binding protein [Clostridiales Family XIII bacterium]|jgi:ribose transport system substrate-binding protein|nr:sugar ABC transporter substrate-binding protein [Clostridiales Family XIII bacterium]